MRQRIFLEHPEWKEVPWARSTIPKLPMQKLLDVVADIPGLQYESDLFLNTTQGKTAETKRWMCDRILSRLRNISLWRWQWDIDYPNIAYPVTIEPRDQLAYLRLQQDLATDSLWFKHFDRAHEYVTYTSGLLLLLQLLDAWDGTFMLKSLFEDLANSDPRTSSEPLLLPNETTSPARVIKEIHRTISYFLHPLNGRSGVYAVYHPLWFWYVLPQTSSALLVLFHYSDSYNAWLCSGLHGPWDAALWKRLKLASRYAVKVQPLD